MTSLKKLKNKWHKELIAWFEAEGICWCERCGRTDTKLDISHGKKQRFLITRELYFFACRLCRACHVWAEHGSHERLERIHRELIEQREGSAVSA